MIALLTVVLVSVVAFVTDFGMAYANQRALQNGVDAAALAAAHTLDAEADEISSCSEMVADTTNVAAARQAAVDYFRANVPNTEATLAPDTDGFSVECTADDKQVLVSVAAEQESPSFFGGLMGVDGVPIGQSSKSMIGTITGAIGVRPFAVCKEQAGDLVESGDILTFNFSNSDGGCGSSAGAFGLLDLDNSTGGGANDLKEWVEHGYPAPLPNFGAMLSENGNEYAALPIDKIMDETVVLPVYDAINSGKYHGVGYITVQVCAWGNHAPPDQKGLCFDSVSWQAALDRWGAGSGHSAPHYMQVRFRDYSPQADLSTACTLGDPGCDFGAHVVKLAD
jgi:hypothetical protein